LHSQDVRIFAKGFQEPEGGMMTRRTVVSAVICYLLFLVSLGSTRAQVASPNSAVDVRQSDKVLFERAMKVMTKANYVGARTLLESLINSHPDSGYVPRAKLSIADSWYAEGAFKQAEVEYRDFITFFPNRPEVAEAQLKIDAIHKKARI
jgi:outer membrane assembly lipoprotein YfiO